MEGVEVVSDLVRDYIKRQLKEKEMRDKRNAGEEKRFTITLSEYDYLRLAYISKTLGLKRSTFSRNIILQALLGAEEVMGLEEMRADVHNGDFIEFTDYGYFINGLAGDEEDEISESEHEDESEENSSKKSPSSATRTRGRKPGVLNTGSNK